MGGQRKEAASKYERIFFIQIHLCRISFRNSVLAPIDKTIRAAEVAGRGWMWRCALLLLLATLREEAPTDFRLYFQFMGNAKSGIARSAAPSFQHRGARRAICALLGLCILPLAAAQE